MRSTRNQARRIAMLALACAVVAEFVARGPYRALHGDSQDLSVHYGAAGAWLRGKNPYDMTEVGRAFRRGGGPPELTPTAARMPSVYPPFTFPVEVPLALLSWHGAVLAVTAVSIALVVAALWMLARAAALTGWRRSVFFLAALALAPLHTGVAEGQVTIPAAALLVIGWVLLRDRPALSAVLVAIGAALKPHLAVPFVAIALVRPNPRWLASAGASLLALFTLGSLRMSAAGFDPMHAWMGSVAAAAMPGHINAAGPENPASLSLIHLDMLLLRFVPAPVATALVIAFVVPLTALAMWRAREAHAGSAPWAMALLCVVSLLAVYHRVYDAVLLWIPLVALTRDWDELTPACRLLGVTVGAAFLVPGPIALDVLAHAGRIPQFVTGSILWDTLLLPHQVWLLVMTALAIAYKTWRHTAVSFPAPERLT